MGVVTGYGLLDKTRMDTGTRSTVMPTSHASVGAMTGHVGVKALLVVSPASARNAITSWEIGWLRTMGWIQCGNILSGWIPTDSSPKIRIGMVNNGSIASGFLVAVPIRSAPNDSTAPITMASTQ